MHDTQILTEDISFSIKRLIENTLLYIIIDYTKTIKFLLAGLKINTKSSYYDTTLYNSVLDNTRGAISFLNLSFKKSISVMMMT